MFYAPMNPIKYENKTQIVKVTVKTLQLTQNIKHSRDTASKLASSHSYFV